MHLLPSHVGCLVVPIFVFHIFFRASINAQRVAGEMKEPESIVSEELSSATLHFSNHRGMNLVNDRPIYGAVHADLKHTDAGTCGTYMAAQYYATETKKRRDELLAKYAAA